jgi:ferredoxin--NADP+ reductase
VYRVERAEEIAERVFEFWVHAPHVARHARAGQFVVVRIDDKGERIPLTISERPQPSSPGSDRAMA